MSDSIDDPEPSRNLGGRPAITSAHQLAAAAQRLFLANGFDQTSVDDIATAVGVSRRTFFRYFATKADVLWVESPAEFARLRENLAAAPDDEPYPTALIRAVLAALAFPPDQREWALHRAQLVFTVPAVQSPASKRFTEWRMIATEFAASRCGLPQDALFPLAVGHAVLAGTLAAHEYWIAHPDEDLFPILEQSLQLLLPREPC
jgi:mycofactocin system transcriptional regulator